MYSFVAVLVLEHWIRRRVKDTERASVCIYMSRSQRGLVRADGTEGAGTQPGLDATEPHGMSLERGGQGGGPRARLSLSRAPRSTLSCSRP